MKILVTGGAGFIGTNYVDYALLKGVEWINIDIKPPAKKYIRLVTENVILWIMKSLKK